MYEAKAFLSTHRALAVCTREFARLTDAVITGTKTLAAESLDPPPIVRLAPDRCIVQLGPVALTITWLRNGSDSPADGSLMAIVWRGNIAPRGDHSPERLGLRRVPPTPVSVWEQSLTPVGESEATWAWRTQDDSHDVLASPALAARCIEQLKLAHDAFTSEASDELSRMSGGAA